MKDMSEVKTVVHMFSKIFQYLDKNPHILKEIFKEESSSKRKIKNQTSITTEITDIYNIYEKRGEKELENTLKGLLLEDLKKIIGHYKLDSKDYYRTWKTKGRCIGCILEKIKPHAEKPKHFLG